MALANARRILVLGPAGSGKSTLAAALGQRLGLPVIHLDAVFWKPGWVEPNREEFLVRVAELARQPEWVIDGNYSYVLDERLARAEHAVYLEAGRWRCLGNVLRRWVAYRGRQRPDMAEGCPEKIDPEFIRWVLWHQPRGRRGLLARLAASRVPLTRVPASTETPRMLADLGLG